MDPVSVYKIGLVCVAVFALFWSFVLDRKKPSSIKEFVAKLLARAVFVGFFFTILLGFFYLLLGLFQGKAG